MIRLLVTCFAAAVLAASPASAQNQENPGSKPRLAAEFSSDWFYDGVPEKLANLTGKEAPALSVDEWHGEARPGDLRGKVVVIDFWGTWCPPCVAAIPKNVELVEKYQREGLVFIGVHDARRGWDRVRQMAGQHRINYPVARDAEGGVSAQKFGLGFWPTYIAIDRQGIVRAAGLKPSRVEDVVKVLLAEPGPGGAAAAAAGAPLEPRYLISSSRRPAALREIEGKPLPPLEGEAWLGEAGAAPSPEQMAGRVVAVLFLSARDRISLHQAGRLAELEQELGADFVAVGVAPADDLWDRLEALAADGKLPGRVMRDRPVEVNGARPLGVFGEACGVRQTPMMLLVDRRGIVRGAGVRPDRLVEAAKLLLAEPKPEPEGEAESAGGVAGGGG